MNRVVVAAAVDVVDSVALAAVVMEYPLALPLEDTAAVVVFVYLFKIYDKYR